MVATTSSKRRIRPWILCGTALATLIASGSCRRDEPSESERAAPTEREDDTSVRVRRFHPITISSDFAEVPAIPSNPGALAGCNVLLVTLDTTRADRVGCYGNTDIETPTLDRLAAGGVIFSRAVAVAPITLPSHSSIMTGLYPSNHGARTNGLFRLGESHRTLAERFRDAGYKTAAFISAFVLDSQFGLGRGFELYDDDLTDATDPLRKHYSEHKAEQTTDRALRWLRQTAPGRFFMWVHYFDPHHDYSPPSPFAERYASNLYDGEIAYVDSQLGRLLAALDELNLTDDTLVVVVGDHGESLSQHGERTHGYLIYDASMRVPLVFNCGSRLGGRVHCAHRVSHVDVAPTVLSLVGLATLPECDGRDLTDPNPSDRPVFCETLYATFGYGWEPLVGVYHGGFKYIHSSQPELYEPLTDPREQDNLIASQRGVAGVMRDFLRDFFGPESDLLARAVPNVQPSAADLAKLQALGYAGGSSEPAHRQSRPHPLDMMEVLHRAETADDDSKSPEQSIAELEAILKDHPDFLPALRYLGSVYLRIEDYQRSADAFARCVEVCPDSPELLFQLASARSRLGDSDEAIRLSEQVLQQLPDHVGARYLLGSTYVNLRRYELAAAELKRVFDYDPDYERCVEALIASYSATGQADALLGIFRDYVKSDPRNARVRVALAKQLEHAGEYAPAIAELKSGLELSPGNAELVNALALLLATCPDTSLRDIANATDLLERYCRAEGQSDAKSMFTLCSLLAQQRRFDEALELAERAKRLAIEAGDQKLAAAVDRLARQLRAATTQPNSAP